MNRTIIYYGLYTEEFFANARFTEEQRILQYMPSNAV